MGEAISRRQFGVAAAAGVLAAHEAVGASQRRPADEEAPLIREVRLQTAVALTEMTRFYRDMLGMAVLAEDPTAVTFAAGPGRLTFTHVDVPKDAEGPFYHFAFNIPRNKILEAREWQLKRTALVPTPPHMRDAAYPDDVRHFRNWNAHSLFFYDPAFNIVEYIARHDLPNDAEGDFSSADLLCISEIGFMVADPASEARAIYDRYGLNEYPRGTEWWAMGDERGLLLCLPLGRVFGAESGTAKTYQVFPTEAVIRAGGEFRFPGYPYLIKSA